MKVGRDESVVEESGPYRGDTGTVSKNVESSFSARKAEGAKVIM